MKTENRAKAQETVDSTIAEAVKAGATDIHFQCFEKGAKIRFRIDRVLQTAKTIGKDEHHDICETFKGMFMGNPQETRLPQDGRCLMKIGKKEIDLQISTAPCVFGESVIVRISSRETQHCFELSKSGMSDDQMATIRKWSARPNGIVLVTGPGSSGKTAVLYGIVNELDKETRSIYTVEDPVEYAIEGVSQIPINSQVGLTFSSALRCILRQDPDVILVGETRDIETCEVMAQMALAGHMVFSSLQTNTATDAVIRLKDIGLDTFLIKDTLAGVTCQRLVRVLCSKCRQSYTPDDFTLEHYGIPKQEYFKAAGCAECGHTGYHGRVGIYELYEPGHATMSMLLKGCSAAELRAQAVSEGMATLFKDGMAKAAAGVTSIDEVLRVLGGVV